MYGQIHVILRALILEKFGKATWQKILEKSGADPTDHFMVFHIYPDELTIKVIAAVCEVLELSLGTVLEIFGEYFFSYCLEHGYDKMLRTLGDNFETFMQNLDALHSYLAMSYKNMKAPSFRCLKDVDGSLILHYYSPRSGLHPIAIGCCKAVGRELYQVEITSEVLEVTAETIEGTTQEHVSFRLRVNSLLDGNLQQNDAENMRLIEQVYTPTEDLEVDGRQSRTFMDRRRSSVFSVADLNIQYPESTIISGKIFCDLFPFHVVFDKDLVIKQCGIKLQKMAGKMICSGMHMSSFFTIIHPVIPLDFNRLLDFINASYVLGMTTASSNGNPSYNLLIKGQMIWLSDISHMIFIGSPRLSSLTEMLEMKIYISDIPGYDVTRELVLLNQQRIAEIEVSKKLDETTAELKKTSIALEAEKHKTETLLNEMLPHKVADQLKMGNRVDAEKFACVTILFSDIVSFTTISAAVQPMDIVNMLNELYSKFDKCTNENDVYKVETIGDAYMVVGGVPEVIPDHAQRIANQGMDMVLKAGEVKSPATGKALQIRVGMHSGSVVAGVVGDKMPRYCLFGDTVNTASRMESHGLPGKIHCSPFSYALLKNNGYKFKSRGKMQIKGKGQMTTYFLYGNTEREIPFESPENAAQEANGLTVLKDPSPVPTSSGNRCIYTVTPDGVGPNNIIKNSPSCNIL